MKLYIIITLFIFLFDLIILCKNIWMKKIKLSDNLLSVIIYLILVIYGLYIIIIF
jgi:hypothetical protein